MKVLITGTGLIGCYAAATLIDAGHDVVLFDLDPHSEYIKDVLGDQTADIRQGDIVNIGDLPEFASNSSGNKFDMVVHTAGVIGGNARANPYRAMRTNLVGTLELAEAASHAGVRRIVYASTHGVYALDRIKEPPFREDAQVTAESVYGASKLSSENILHSYSEVSGMQVVALRFTNIYGYGEFIGGSSGGRSFQQLVVAALNNESIPIPQSLNGMGEWLYVKDAATAIRDALEHALNRTFTLLNIGSGVLEDENDIVRAVQKWIPNAKFEVSKSSNTAQRSTERFQPFDLTRARQEIGYNPKFNLISGVGDFINELNAGKNWRRVGKA